MSLLDRLRDLGSALKILKVAPRAADAAPAPTPATSAKPATGVIAMRTVKLSDLATEIRGEELRALADGPVELSVPFAKVFETAGIKPGAHGWTVERLTQVLRSESLRQLDRPAVQKALMELLARERVPVEDLVRDAVARDQALDHYELFAQQKREERAEARARKTSELQSKIRELQAECGKLAASAQQEEASWREWRERKIANEKELAWTVSFLLDRPVISIDEKPLKK
jgi:hypothetical protein